MTGHFQRALQQFGTGVFHQTNCQIIQRCGIVRGRLQLQLITQQTAARLHTQMRAYIQCAAGDLPVVIINTHR